MDLLEDDFKINASASVVLYNNSEKQLKGLLESFPFNYVELIVYDNSPNDSLKLFFKDYPCTYFNSSNNVGFGRGHNEAFKLLKNISDYHFIINPDVKFDQNVIGEMIRFMDSDISIGLSAPKIVYPDGSLQYSCRLLPSPIDLFFRRFPIRTFKKRAVKHELRFTDYKQAMDVPFLLGCFFVFRTEVFMSIDGFDERYFMYLEDADISRKVLKISRVAFNSEVSVYHEYARGSTRNYKLFKYHLESAFKYFQKWGWCFDKERKIINRKTLELLNYKDK